jgi:hypothetical protein
VFLATETQYMFYPFRRGIPMKKLGDLDYESNVQTPAYGTMTALAANVPTNQSQGAGLRKI